MLLHLLQHKGSRRGSNITRLIERLLYTKLGQVLISLLFGCSLAFLFQKVCKDQKCIVIEAPELEEVEGHVFEVGDACYEYIPRIVPCVIDNAS